MRDAEPKDMRGSSSPRSIGVLVTGADWAIAHGDLEALADVTRHLSGQAAGSTRRALVEISELCRSDPDRACAQWCRLRRTIGRRMAN